MVFFMLLVSLLLLLSNPITASKSPTRAPTASPTLSPALTRAPTPTNFKPISSHPTSRPTSVPTSIPTSSPTYGPASMTVVEYIMGGVLGGILFLIVTYFILGYYMYVVEIAEWEKQTDEKEKREEEFRRRMSVPHGKYFGDNDSLIRAPKQIDIEEEVDEDETGKNDSNKDIESIPLLEQGMKASNSAGGIMF